jgi:hypothetical protein
VIYTCHDGDTCSAVTADGQRHHVRLRIGRAQEHPSGPNADAGDTLVVVTTSTCGLQGTADRLVADSGCVMGGTAGSWSLGAAWVEPGYSTDPGCPTSGAAQRAFKGSGETPARCRPGNASYARAGIQSGTSSAVVVVVEARPAVIIDPEERPGKA